MSVPNIISSGSSCELNYLLWSAQRTNVLASSDEKARYQQAYEQWIRSNGGSVVVQTNPAAFSDSIFTHPNKMTVSIRQPKDSSDRIILAANLSIPHETQQLIISFPELEQAAFSHEIALLMIQIGVQFSFRIQENILQGITVERTIYGQSMTKQVFFDNLYRIIDALVALQLKFQQMLGSGGLKRTTAGNETATSFYG